MKVPRWLTESLGRFDSIVLPRRCDPPRYEDSVLVAEQLVRHILLVPSRHLTTMLPATLGLQPHSVGKDVHQKSRHPRGGRTATTTTTTKGQLEVAAPWTRALCVWIPIDRSCLLRRREGCAPNPNDQSVVTTTTKAGLGVAWSCCRLVAVRSSC